MLSFAISSHFHCSHSIIYIYLFENVMDLCQNSRGHLISRFSSLSVSPIISSFGIISNSFTFLCSYVDDIHNRKINNKKNNRLFYYFSLLSSSVVGHDSRVLPPTPICEVVKKDLILIVTARERAY